MWLSRQKYHILCTCDFLYRYTVIHLLFCPVTHVTSFTHMSLYVSCVQMNRADVAFFTHLHLVFSSSKIHMWLQLEDNTTIHTKKTMCLYPVVASLGNFEGKHFCSIIVLKYASLINIQIKKMYISK